MPKINGTPKIPTSLRISSEDLNLLNILNMIPKYPPHKVKSKFFSLLIKDRVEFLIKEYSDRSDLNETEQEVLDLLLKGDN